jgi:adenosylhomocysteine nucleosidase
MQKNRIKHMSIGIIGAMEEEIKLLRSSMTDITEENISGFVFYKGILGGTEVVLTLSGIGKVKAAMATTLLITKYDPDYIINTGSAGGLVTGLKVCDLVVSSEVRHHDADATVFGYEYGQIPQMPPAYIPSNKLIDVAESVIHKMESVKVHKGLIASGDSFMSDPARVEDLKQLMPDIYAVEMEAAGIAQACHIFSKEFVVIRCISDIAGEGNSKTYDEFLQEAGHISAEMVINIINALN